MLITDHRYNPVVPTATVVPQPGNDAFSLVTGGNPLLFHAVTDGEQGVVDITHS